ncbi:MAG: MurR/RpiR family transcriptional regulator [Desulfobacterales bacterium]|nr:MurR/RpiR family transcriptional regulator [Desulfobacterales bacterium]
MKLIERLGRAYPEMTENQRRIYDLLSKDVKAFSLKSITEVADELGISKTSLMRFGKAYGFSGYAEFRKTLQEEEVLDVSPANKMKKILGTDYALNADEIRQQEIDNINAAFENMDEVSLAALSEEILSAANIYTMAWGFSSHLAELFSLRMKIMGLPGETITRRTGTLLEETSHLFEGSLLVVFEMPPYVHEVMDAVAAAKERGVFIVVVTDKPVCPLLRYADLHFCCPTDTRFFGNSLTAPLFFVNMITSQVIFQIKDQVMDRLEDQHAIFKNDRYYIQ